MLVAGDIGKFAAAFFNSCQQFRRPFGQFLAASASSQGVLVLGAADAAVDLHILHGLHEKGDALDILGGLAQAVDDLVRRLALRWSRGFRLMYSRPVLTVALTVPAPTKEATLCDIRIFADDVGDCALPLDHGLEGDGLRGIGDADDHAGVLLRQADLSGR